MAGGCGMIGAALAEALIEDGATVSITTHHTKPSEVFARATRKRLSACKANLTKPEDCDSVTKNIDCVFQVAAVYGGILANRTNPVEMMSPNLLIQTNMIEAAHKNIVERFQFVSTGCVSAANTPNPYRERYGLTGEPHPDNAPYGWAKRIGEIQARYYAEEHGMKISIIRFFNVYGPRDNFHPTASHAVAALVRKIVERQDPFRVWGNGRTVRDLLYVTDAARGMMLALAKYPKPDPINIAAGRKGATSMMNVIRTLCSLTDFHPRFIFDKTKPSGNQVRYADVSKAKRLLNFTSKIPLREGLARTLEWYEQHQATAKSTEL